MSEQIQPTAPPPPAAAQVPPVSTIPRRPPPPEHKDGLRETAETIVFVVVLVLLLKTFVAEAFVIPTGSMASTLLGYHKEAECRQCKYRFEVNASDEAEDRPNRPLDRVVAGICPNCFFRNELHDQEPGPPWLMISLVIGAVVVITFLLMHQGRESQGNVR